MPMARSHWMLSEGPGGYPRSSWEKKLGHQNGETKAKLGYQNWETSEL